MSNHFRYAIIGTGFSGLCAAIKLLESGRDDFIMLERGNDVGGTWRDNHYPGAACDVPSHLYSFSFAQNPDWSRKYPTQPELLKYQQDIAKRYALTPKIRLNHTVTRAAFDDDAQLWRIETSQGAFTATILIAGNGALAEPALPNVPGLDGFQGHTFHSADWDHDYDLTGKRVAVVGTGASAIQFVPEIVESAGHVDIYQRTPPWIIPRPDRAITRVEKWLLRHFKPMQWLYRGLIYWGHEARVLGTVVNPKLALLYQALAKRLIRKQVADPVMRQRITPDYSLGCKRVLISNDWYPALQHPNASLLDGGVREVRANAVVGADGAEREVDCIIFGTGFHATDNPMAEHIFGRNGVSLAQAWGDGMQAYVGSTVSGFPNLFLVVGPNTGLGHSSMIYMIESCMLHIIKGIDALEQRQARTVEVRDDVMQRFNARLQTRLQGSIWATGCKSWYQDANGKITTLWPGFTFGYRRQARRFNADDYQFEGGS